MGYRGQSYRDASAQRGPTRDPELDFLVRMIFHMALFNEPEETKRPIRNDLDDILKRLASEEKEERARQDEQNNILKRIAMEEQEARDDMLGPHPHTPHHNKPWSLDDEEISALPLREEEELRLG